MRSLIEAAFSRPRTVLLALCLILISGVYVYQAIPKEADPDINIPIVYVSMNHEGISPEDAERLLVRPMEQELQSIEGVDEMTSVASQGHASVTLEFQAGMDIDQAMDDVREKVDLVKPDLPSETDEPTVNEVNFALFPVIVVTLSGDVPERALLKTARDLQDRVEGLPNVLEVDIAGDREELLEVIIDPMKLESYGIEEAELLDAVRRNNLLVAAGALDTGEGRFAIKVPGVFEDVRDVLELAVKVDGDAIITVGDIASGRRTFKDATGFARVNGKPALALEVKKRLGTNIIETIEQVQAVVAEERQNWPPTIDVGFTQDKSDDIESMLRDLQNNVLSAVLLVMIVVIAALGLRSSGLVGLAVPGSFLTGILVLGIMGLTVNIVVLFALILAVGMLVDGAIVVTEYADRKMAEGLNARKAYKRAAQRMAWPITASTATTLAAFAPLLFWPGIVGEFMKYLPITLLATLTASLMMALVFVPVLGSVLGRSAKAGTRASLAGDEAHKDLHEVGGLVGAYVRFLKASVRRPLITLAIAICVAAGGFMAYGTFGKGVEFFPDVEPELAQVHIHARGDLSAYERDDLVREVEGRILDVDGVDVFYSRTGVDMSQGNNDIDEDVIGIISMEFADWRTRRPAAQIMDEIRTRTADLAGIRIEVRKEEQGPPTGKDVQIEVASRFPDLLPPVIDTLRAHFDADNELIDVADSRPIPGIEWRLDIDRDMAARFGTDVASVGSVVQLVTNGVLVGTYRPDDADEELDIRARYPAEDRSLERFDLLRVHTPLGMVPISNFVTRDAVTKTGTLSRVDGRRVLTVTADTVEGVLPDTKVQELQAWLDTQDFDPRVELRFRGQNEEQAESSAFLSKAFGVALFLIAIILVTQFNSFYQAFLILSAIVFSTVGVFMGQLIMQQPFGIVMSGVGVIALAGIVVNNNIVLIDTYNDLRRRGLDAFDAVLLTGAQRLRPVLLTTVTTVLGLMPMVLKINIDLFTRQITLGGPSTDWWAQLATAVAGGLTFATLLTLVLTPSLLMLQANASAWLSRRFARKADKPDAPTPPKAGPPHQDDEPELPLGPRPVHPWPQAAE
ncbi:MAG: efflux RND transporter permease subunit [Geminicoccaceae bacterium]